MAAKAIEYIQVALDALERAETLKRAENWDKSLADALHKATSAVEGVLLSAQDAEYEAHQQ